MYKNNQQQILNNSEEILLKDVFLKVKFALRYLLSKWIVLLTAGIIGGGIGFVYAWEKKVVYKAELNFVVQDDKSAGGLSSALGLASEFGLNLGGSAGGEFSGDNLLALMKSRSIIEKTLLATVTIKGKSQTLADFYIDINNIRKNWEKNAALKDLHFPINTDRSKFTLTQDSVLGVFHSKLITNDIIFDKVDKKTSINSLTITSTNELFSKYFAEMLTDVVSNFYIQTKTKKALQSVVILQRQVDSVRRALNSAILGVASSADASPSPNPLLQSLRVPSQRRQVDVQANTAILGELVKNLEVSKMALLQQTPLIQVVDRPILPLEAKKPGIVKMAIVGAAVSIILVTLFLYLRKLFADLNS